MTHHRQRRTGRTPITFHAFATRQITRKRQAGRENTADLYRTTRNWLHLFCGGRDLGFDRITPAFVRRFVDFLAAQGLRANSVRTYFSNLRALYNEAMREGIISYRAGNPFREIRLRRESTTPRAISTEVVGRLAAVRPATERLRLTADLCLFSFLACGMPFVDLAHLTTANVREGELAYRRHKTGTLIRIGITDGMPRLIDRHHRDGSPFLFPIFKGSVTHEGYKSLLRSYNRNLREIARCYLNLDTKLTSYVMRHSWATAAYRSDTPIAVIGQALGHTSEKTTRCYLAALDQSEVDKANRRVTGAVDRIVVRGGTLIPEIRGNGFFGIPVQVFCRNDVQNILINCKRQGIRE